MPEGPRHRVMCDHGRGGGETGAGARLRLIGAALEEEGRKGRWIGATSYGSVRGGWVGAWAARVLKAPTV